MPTSEKTGSVILAGGFGGTSTVRRLEQLGKRRRDVEIVLVSREDFVLMIPLLFEVCSGHPTPTISPTDPRSCGPHASSKQLRDGQVTR